jgi:hypothetical protein
MRLRHVMTRRGELLAGVVLSWAGTVLLFQAFEGRGRSRGLGVKMFLPGG